MEGGCRSLFNVSRSLTFFFGLGMLALLYYFANRAKRKLPAVRPIEAFVAIKEAVGRATELGRPLHFSTGGGALTGDKAPETLAGLRILSDTAKMCAEYECELINTVMVPLVIPISESIVKQGYSEAGKAELYSPSIVRFVSPMQFSYAAGVMELMRSERIAANIQIGRFAAEAFCLLKPQQEPGPCRLAVQ
jgi:hypothetical protein